MVMGGEFCDMHTEPAGQSNVHLEHASDSGPTGLSGRRLTQAAEGRALQWASLGVTHMSNLKSHHQDQEGRPVATNQMTPEEAEDCATRCRGKSI